MFGTAVLNRQVLNYECMFHSLNSCRLSLVISTFSGRDPLPGGLLQSLYIKNAERGEFLSPKWKIAINCEVSLRRTGNFELWFPTSSSDLSRTVQETAQVISVCSEDEVCEGKHKHGWRGHTEGQDSAALWLSCLFLSVFQSWDKEPRRK